MDKTCSISGCAKPAPRNRKGWCSAHYSRWHRHGDPHAGGTPRGEVLQYFNETVLNYEGDDCLLWPYSRNHQGYAKAKLNGGIRIVPRVVCEHVNGPPPTPEHEAAHSCGKGHEGCVTKRHLSWKTHTENAADRVAHGTILRGEAHPNTGLTEQDVLAIRQMRGTMSQSKIASKFGVAQVTVSQIQRGVRWGWLQSIDELERKRS